MTYDERLIGLVLNDRYVMKALKAVQQIEIENWCIGAGMIRDLVWRELHQYSKVSSKDIDVVYYDRSGEIEDEKEIENKLKEFESEYAWEVTNQALVHLWYKDDYGKPITPNESLSDGISKWPEIATCVGVYLDRNNQVQIIAPYGLEDLFDMIWRRNPKKSKGLFETRIHEKQIEEKWPKVKIILD